jgi:hypothetical protein
MDALWKQAFDDTKAGGRTLHRFAALLFAEPAPVQAIGYEEQTAIREGHRNASEDAYFAARPAHNNDISRVIFRHGFDRGYDTTPPAQPAPVQPAKIGTIGHIDNGKATLTASILSALQATPPAAPTVQEPLAWCTKSELENMAKGFSQDVPARSMRVPQLYQKESTVLLYTATQPAPVPLTDEQIDAAIKAWFATDIVAGRQPFAKRMRAAFAAAHAITEGGAA